MPRHFSAITSWLYPGGLFVVLSLMVGMQLSFGPQGSASTKTDDFKNSGLYVPLVLRAHEVQPLSLSKANVVGSCLLHMGSLGWQSVSFLCPRQQLPVYLPTLPPTASSHRAIVHFTPHGVFALLTLFEAATSLSLFVEFVLPLLGLFSGIFILVYYLVVYVGWGYLRVFFF